MPFECKRCGRHSRPCPACESCDPCCDTNGCRNGVDEDASESVTPRNSAESWTGTDNALPCALQINRPVAFRSVSDEILDKSRQFAGMRGVTAYGAIVNRRDGETEVEITITIQEDGHA